MGESEWTDLLQMGEETFIGQERRGKMKQEGRISWSCTKTYGKWDRMWRS